MYYLYVADNRLSMVKFLGVTVRRSRKDITMLIPIFGAVLA